MTGVRARVSVALLPAMVASLVVAGTAAGTAVGEQPGVQTSGDPVFADDFADGMARWRAVTGSLDEWQAGGTEFPYVTVDTLGQASGRYVTPEPALVLPEAYQIRVRARIDNAGGGSSVPLNVLTDWTDTSAPTRENLALQINGLSAMRMARPVAGAIVCAGSSPGLLPGEWFDIVMTRAAGILAVEINGERVAAVPAGALGGTVGIGVYQARTSVDSIAVSALDEVPDGHPTEPTGCDWDPAPEPPDGQPVLLNQSGFNTDRPKRFTAPLAEDGAPFTVVDADDAVRFEGVVEGGVGDFSEFRPEDAGDFRVVVEGESGHGESVPFGIGASWLERVSYENAVAFMSGSRCYYGDAAAPDVGWNGSRCRWSVMWRDGDTYSFEIPTLIDLFSANPSAFDDLRFDDEVYLGMAYELPPETPEIVRLIAWGVDRMLAHDVNHTLWKGQLAAFLRAYPDLAEWIPAQMYEDARDHLFPIWGHAPHDRFTSVHDYTPHTADLFQTYTQVGTGKGEFPPGHSMRPNLDMYEVALREGRDDAEAYLDAARRNAAWIVDNLDWEDPSTTKGQRMSEHITVTGLVGFLRRNPEQAPAGLQQKIEDWAEVAVSRSDNLWDFRKYSADRWTIPTFTGGGSGEDPNETGNIAGFAAPALAASTVVDDPALGQRLTEIALAHVDNIFGRNPVGRHASHRAPTEQWGFEGVERGWFSEWQGGFGQLQGVRGVLDGSPKNAHYPYNPQVGNIGHSEGWVAFNTAWNESLAWLADAETAVRVLEDAGQPTDRLVLGSPVEIELRAPLNLDAAVLDEAEVQVRIGDVEPVRLTVRQDALNSSTFSGALDAAALGAEPSDVVTVSYGLGSFAEEVSLTVEAADACPDGYPADTTVTFGDFDSGVPNYDRGDGCTFLDVIYAQAPFPNHGALVRSVAATAEQWRADGLLTREESAAVVAAAARSNER